MSDLAHLARMTACAAISAAQPLCSRCQGKVFNGIPLVERLKERTCGVWVVHLETGQTVGFLRFEAGVQKIFAVQVLPGIRFPDALEWEDERLAHTYVLPDAVLAEMARPTTEALARSPAMHFQRGTALYRRGKLDDAKAAHATAPPFPSRSHTCSAR